MVAPPYGLKEQFAQAHRHRLEVQFYTRTELVTSRWRDPGTSKVERGFPQVG